jgi:hypothetical protein
MNKKFQLTYKSLESSFIENGVLHDVTFKLKVNSFHKIPELPNHVVFETAEDCGTIIIRDEDVLTLDEIKE